jgi:mannan endo-1,4-beta-mannosidase
MNGKWFPWGGKPDLFINAWIHTWKIFKEEGANNIKWIFSPNVIYRGKNFEKGILQYYPGEKFVDIVSLDGYNFGDNCKIFMSWRPFMDTYNISIIGLKTLNKPMWITEVGCSSDKRRPKWLIEFFEYFNNSDFELFIWFNDNKKTEPNFRIDADNESKKIFQKLIKKLR